MLILNEAFFQEAATSFLRFNTISFVASLSVTLLLVSGVPLKNELTMQMLSIGTRITLTFHVLTYLFVVPLSPHMQFGKILSLSLSSLGLFRVIVLFTINDVIAWLMEFL